MNLAATFSQTDLAFELPKAAADWLELKSGILAFSHQGFRHIPEIRAFQLLS
jgi:hypothetical protein